MDKVVGIDYGITTGLAVVRAVADLFPVEHVAELYPKPDKDFFPSLSIEVNKCSRIPGAKLIVVVETWPEQSPMDPAMYHQVLAAVNDIKPDKFIQVKPVEWKVSRFTRNSKFNTVVPPAYNNYRKSQHCMDAIGMARYIAHKLDRSKA